MCLIPPPVTPIGVFFFFFFFSFSFFFTGGALSVEF